MGRRVKGSGSIYARKDGTVIGQYEIETPEGKKRKYIRGKDSKDVASRLAKAIADRDSGYAFDSQNLTVSEFMSRWLTSIKGTIRDGSWKQYEMVNRVHIEPVLGHVKLERLTTLQVQAFYHKKLESGVSPRRTLYIHATLHKALNQAVVWSLVPRNVTDGVEKPRHSGRAIEPFGGDQVKMLLKAVEGDRLEALYVLAVTTGMRQGELLGLKWEDVDLDDGVLRVNRTIFGGIVSPPKTRSGRRSIRLSKAALASLSRHKANSNGSEWVFCTKSGKPIDCSNLTKQSWKPLLKKANLPYRRFHDLRHTCATLLLKKSVHPKIVQSLMGHASISITLDTYSHVLPDMQDEVVSAMDTFLGEEA